jgi:hypothetical protein
MTLLAVLITLAFACAGVAVFLTAFRTKRPRGRDDGGGGRGGGGGAVPRRPTPPPSPCGDDEPPWWPEFERELARYQGRRTVAGRS